MPTAKNINDFIGQRFGSLVVAGAEKVQKIDGKYVTRWRCLCDCGGSSIVRPPDILKGKTRSCGCKQSDWIKAHKDLNLAHGHKRQGEQGTPTYVAWQSMKQRCLYKKHKAYRQYGGRGITVCQRWIDSFENFLADMGERPSKEHTIDRKDGAKGYEPGNCRWATLLEQAENRRTTRMLTAFGETKSIRGWLSDARCVTNKTTLVKRVDDGWDAERAISQPMKPDCRRRPIT